jgi:hypothetical protein
MRWKQGRRSTNVEDRRGRGVSRGVAIGGGGLGLLVVVLIALLLGVDPTQLLTDVSSGQVDSSQSSAPPPPGQDEASDFVSVVLADTEDTWTALFADNRATYSPPRLVLFSDAVRSACGLQSAAVGPFYCPADRRVYLDLVFFDELRRRFGAPGDFAEAYVIAHEVGHHVQNLLGISDRVHAQQQRASTTEVNALSVRLELQADCFAGVWGYHAQRMRNVLEPGDLEEALTAAAAIGDDRLQRQSRGTVVPDSFTHGTSAQRVEWFRRGFDSGDPDACDTF